MRKIMNNFFSNHQFNLCEKKNKQLRILRVHLRIYCQAAVLKITFYYVFFLQIFCCFRFLCTIFSLSIINIHNTDADTQGIFCEILYQ